jgi:hypothetical protein
MRAYFFGNMYLSSIQQGIQAAHATHELFTKWNQPSLARSNLLEWAENHKTMILLNGGYAATIQELVDFLAEQGDHSVTYPYAPFYEEEASLNGALTTVGVILPEKIYLTAAAIRNERFTSREDSMTIRDQIWENGSFVVGPENTLGFTVEKQTVLEFTKWEAQLLDRLNGFAQMAS